MHINTTTIRILHCEMRIWGSARGSLFWHREALLRDQNSDPEGKISLSALNSHGLFYFFLHTFRLRMFQNDVDAGHC